MKISIATKILSIALFVVLAMAGTSAIDFRASSTIATEIASLSEEYTAAYGALARLNIRSLEQSYVLRRYVIRKLLNIRPERPRMDDELEMFYALEEEFKNEMAMARSAIAKELGSESQTVDRAALGRIDERLVWISQQQAHHKTKRDAAIASFAKGDIEAFKHQFKEIEEWRSFFIPYVDETRAMLLSATREAGKRAAESQARATVMGAVILCLSAVFAIGVSFVFIRQLVRPVRRLLEGTQDITAGNYDVTVPVTTHDEIGRLTHAFNRMAEGLRIGARAREMFGKYLDPRIAQKLLDKPYLLNHEGERRVMTVMFCDLKGFTFMSEVMTPRGLVTVINRHFTLMAGAVRDYGGVIDKFMGDAMMAFWGPPFGQDEEQAPAAVGSALMQVDCLLQLTSELPDLVHTKGALPALDIRIGIATGEVLVGSIGSAFMRSYTVMGDAVNLASRLESVNKVYGTRVLLAEETARRIGPALELREVDTVVVLGQSHPVRIFEALGHAGEVPANRQAMRDAYLQGLMAYRACDWAGARGAFGEALREDPEDGPSSVMLARIDALEMAPPPEGWDGAWSMSSK